MIKNKFNTLRATLLFGMLLLTFFSVRCTPRSTERPEIGISSVQETKQPEKLVTPFDFDLGQYENLSKPFDETEFLKTHYLGVDCSSLTGSVTFGDYGISAQEACAGERAWYENNILFCDYFTYRDECIEWMAVKTGDLQLCEMKELKRGGTTRITKESWKFECYEQAAIYRDDLTICDSIPYSRDVFKQKCIDGAQDGKTYLQFPNSPIRPYCLQRDSAGKCIW